MKTAAEARSAAGATRRHSQPTCLAVPSSASPPRHRRSSAYRVASDTCTVLRRSHRRLSLPASAAQPVANDAAVWIAGRNGAGLRVAQHTFMRSVLRHVHGHLTQDVSFQRPRRLRYRQRNVRTLVLMFGVLHSLARKRTGRVARAHTRYVGNSATSSTQAASVRVATVDRLVPRAIHMRTLRT